MKKLIHKANVSKQLPYLPVALFVLLPGCSGSYNSSPNGDIIRTGALIAAGQTVINDVVNNRPVSPDTIFQAATIVVAGEIAASAEDQRYAAQKAAQYKRAQGKYRYVAVRTPSSRGSTKPAVVIVDTKTNQPVDNNKRVLESEPKTGKAVYISDFEVEYLR